MNNDDDDGDDDDREDDDDESEHLCAAERTVSPLSAQVSALICRENICLILKYLG